MSSRLSLEALEVLDAIDRKGSFAAAAAALYRVPSAVTYSVQKLEEGLGVSLFRREGRRSVLTPAGRLLLDQGRELLEAADRLAEAARQVDSGWESQLTIAIDSVLEFDVIYPHLAEFYRVNPAIDINLCEEVLGGAWEAAIEGRADLVLGAAEPPGATQGLRYAPMGSIDWLFAVSADHPLTQMSLPLAEADFQVYRAVVVRDSSRSMPPQSRRVFERQAQLRVGTMQQKIEAQVAGLGVGFLPRHRVAAQLAKGTLVELAVEGGVPATPLHLVWRAGSRGRALRWFIERLRVDEDS